MIEGLVALRPKKRRNTVAWIAGAGVLFVIVSLAADRSVREAVASWSDPAAAPAPVVPRRAPARPIAPIRALAIAPMSPPPVLREAAPTPRAPAPTSHPHRRAKKHGARKDR